MGIFDGLKKKWKLKSTKQVVVILLVFACTGLSALFSKNAFYYLMDINPKTLHLWQKIAISFTSLFVLYPIFLLFYGYLFGQFAFFWDFKKRMYQRIAQLFSTKKK